MKKKLLVFCLILLFGNVIKAQDWNQIIKTASSTRAADNQPFRSANDNFGKAVAVDATYAVVSCSGDNGDAFHRNLKSGAGSVVILQNISGNWQQIRKIVPNDRAIGDAFGVSVAISGSTIVVGSSNNATDVNGANNLLYAGAAYVFNKDAGGFNNWGQVKKLVASDRAAGNTFGYSVAISGNNVVIGADYNETDVNNTNTIAGAGAAYVFNANQGGTHNWGQVKKLIAGDRASVFGFGNTVSISANVIVIGTNGGLSTDVNGLNQLEGAGAAYVFSINQGGANNWGQVKKLVAAVRAADHLFGFSVCINGSIIVVGALYNDKTATDAAPTRSNAGAAYIFSIDQGGVGNWGQVKKIVASDRNIDHIFGYSVAIYSNTIVVSALGPSGTDAGGLNNLAYAGAAYIFGKDQGGTNNWGQIKKIAASDRTAGDNFAFSIAIYNTTVFVGAQGNDSDPSGTNILTNAGAAYVFSADQGGVANWGQVSKNVAMPNASDYLFGYAVSMDGDYAVVGSFNDPWDFNATNPIYQAGAAYVLKNVNGLWTQVKKLVANDRSVVYNFGSSVSISGSNIVIGSANNRTDVLGANYLLGAGAAYVFNKDEGGIENWGQLKKIVPSDRGINNTFGNAVSISGDIIAVGAQNNTTDVAGANILNAAGAAYIFSKDQGGSNNWGQVKKIVAGDRAINNNFGRSLSLNGNTIVLGSNNGTDVDNLNNVAGAGAAYIFNANQGGINNWGQVKKITANDRTINNLFGISVTISGNFVAVGSFRNSTDNLGQNAITNAGSVYIFGKDQGSIDNWGLIKKVVANDRAASDAFGISVSMSGSLLLVGSWVNKTDASNSNTISNAGAAYVFKKDQGGINNWGQVKKIVASDRASNNYFGVSTSISNDMLIIGAYSNSTDQSGSNFLSGSGSAYIFKDICNVLPIASSNTQIATAQNSTPTAYTNANCNLVATIAPSGAIPIIGHTNAKLWIETIQPNVSNNEYVKRHYEITPANNPSTSTGKVTLYFTQQDFDDFNATSASIKLPTNSSDATGKSALLIEKRPGISIDSSGLPSSYLGTPITLDPIDSDIIWNNTENRWEVTFDVSGFSGFFVKTTSGTLPLNWLSLNANINSSKQAVINWKVQEINVSNFEIQKSSNSATFVSIGLEQSKGDGENDYTFTETQPLIEKAFYRIMQKDRDGKFTYSKIIMLNPNRNSLVTVFPNPTADKLTINLSNNLLLNTKATIINMLGKQIQIVNINKTSTEISLESFASGIYLLKLQNGEVIKLVKK